MKLYELRVINVVLVVCAKLKGQYLKWEFRFRGMYRRFAHWDYRIWLRYFSFPLAIGFETNFDWRLRRRKADKYHASTGNLEI